MRAAMLTPTLAAVSAARVRSEVRRRSRVAWMGRDLPVGRAADSEVVRARRSSEVKRQSMGRDSREAKVLHWAVTMVRASVEIRPQMAAWMARDLAAWMAASMAVGSVASMEADSVAGWMVDSPLAMAMLKAASMARDSQGERVVGLAALMAVHSSEVRRQWRVRG